MISSTALNRISKFLSLVLRHSPETIGVRIDANGWVNIDELIEKANSSGKTNGLDHTAVHETVETSEKNRFSISDNGQKIRANQGHSIDVDLQLDPLVPPEYLYHGTATRFIEKILAEGITPQQRQQVHLSPDTETAVAIGRRHGKPITLKVESLTMHKQGFNFYLSLNGVWLTEKVPSRYILY